MGKPTWILLPKVQDFRWMLNRMDSPWYPSGRLFRQETRGEWEPVIEEVYQALYVYQQQGKGYCDLPLDKPLPKLPPTYADLHPHPPLQQEPTEWGNWIVYRCSHCHRPTTRQPESDGSVSCYRCLHGAAVMA
jgi:hypothetical protein